MADVERQLLSKAAHGGQVEKLMGDGIEEEHFLDPECGRIWEWLCEHVRKYRTSPSMNVIRDEFPSHDFEIVTD